MPAVNNALLNAWVGCDYSNTRPESNEIRIINQPLINHFDTLPNFPAGQGTPKGICEGCVHLNQNRM